MKYTFLFNEVFHTALVLTAGEVKVFPALLERVHVHPELVEHCQTKSTS